MPCGWLLWLLSALLVLQQGFFIAPAPAFEGVNEAGGGQVRNLPYARAVSAPAFEDVSEAAGVVNNRQGTARAIGQAWGDFDQDGWVDLYVTDPAGPNTLYRNQGDGTFVAATDPAVALAQAESAGAIFADYDNDGWPDLYVLNWGANVLLRNVAGRFEDVTAAAGLAGQPDANSQSAAWGDFDRDGYLDVYVANWACYPRCGRPTTGDRDRLYRNNGDGTFTDVTDWLGVKTVGAGFVASFVDYDNDGDPDIYLVNDEFIHPIGNVLWRNDGPGCDGWCFTEVAQAAGADTRVMGMGLATLDYDNDGDFDFYFSNAGPMTLLQNQGQGVFVDVAPAAGVAAADAIAWAAVPLDYDNDGWQDLYLAVMTQTDGRPGPDRLFRNQGDGQFTLVEGSGVDRDGRTLGAATADYDQDGRVDLVIGNHDSGYRLYRNTDAAAAGRHWLALRLVGGGPVNRDAVGARVSVTTPDGHTQWQAVINGGSLGAGNDLTLHFGLGQAERADVTVVWPDGQVYTWRRVTPDQRLILDYAAPPLHFSSWLIGLMVVAGAAFSGLVLVVWRRAEARREPRSDG